MNYQLNVNNIKIISENLQRRATSPGGGAGRPDSDHVSRAAGAAFAPGRLGIALPVQEQGAKNMLFFASYSICPLLNPIPLDSVAIVTRWQRAHQTRALPPVCPWRIEIVRVVLLGTHDAQSPLHQLQGQRSVLELIIRGWAWPEVLVNSARLWAPELFLDVLMAEMLAANPGVTDGGQAAGGAGSEPRRIDS